jgi:serine/threonine protein kinase
VIGQRISNYRIGTLIGEGGMGAVYAAEHMLIGRKVAIKFLKRQLGADAEVVARFLNEARAISAIRHPGIIEVLDVGALEDGIPYMVMELLWGQTLSRRMGQGRLPLADVLIIGGQVASALHAAHVKGITHRDLKPDNLFLVDDDEARRDGFHVKLLDFGIAKLKKEVPHDTVQTRTGSILGTPAYMSPEQCRGISRQIDQRTDVYSLGVILFELICGRLPFLSEGGGEMMVMHLRDAPPPMSRFTEGVPPRVEAVVMKALAKEPDDRFASMQEMTLALGQCLAQLDRSAPPNLGHARTAPMPVATTLAPPRTTTLSSTTGARDVVVARKPRRLVAVAAVAILSVVAAGGLLLGRRALAPVARVTTSPTVTAAVPPALPDPPPPLKVEPPAPPPREIEAAMGEVKAAEKPAARIRSGKKKAAAKRPGMEAW